MARGKCGPVETCCNSAFGYLVKAEDFCSRGRAKEAKDQLNQAARQMDKAGKDSRGKAHIKKLVTSASYHITDAIRDLDDKRFGSARLQLKEADHLVSAARTESSLKKA